MKSVLRIGLGVAVAAIPIFSQTPGASRPTFEVASIKVHPPPLTRITIMNQPGGRFVAEGMSLKMLIGRAYSVPEVRVVGGPNWADSDRFDIEARAEGGNMAPAQMPLLLQGLLEDRFQLKMHRETKELSVYELVVLKGGPRMKLSADQTPQAPLAPAERGAGPGPRGDAGPGARGPGDGTRGGPGASPFGGGPLPRGAFGIGRGRLQGTAVPITNLVNFLTNQLGRPVMDKTGLTGLFDIKLEYAPGAEQAPGPFGPNPDAPLPPPVDGPSIFTAIQEQLGLKLESAKGPLEVVVIDTAQKPSEN